LRENGLAYLSSGKGGDLSVCTLVMDVGRKHKVRRFIVPITRWCCCSGQFSCCPGVGKNLGLGTQSVINRRRTSQRLTNWRVLDENTHFIVSHSLITQIEHNVKLEKFNLWGC